MSGHLRPAFVLSWLIVLLATAASAAGLLAHDLYRDNTMVTAAALLLWSLRPLSPAPGSG
jgi:hypothetical protein